MIDVVTMNHYLKSMSHFQNPPKDVRIGLIVGGDFMVKKAKLIVYLSSESNCNLSFDCQ